MCCCNRSQFQEDVSSATWCLLRTVVYVVKKHASGVGAHQTSATASLSSLSAPSGSTASPDASASPTAASPALYEALFGCLELALALSDHTARARLAQGDAALEALDRLARAGVPPARHYLELDARAAALVCFLSAHTSATASASPLTLTV